MDLPDHPFAPGVLKYKGHGKYANADGSWTITYNFVCNPGTHAMAMISELPPIRFPVIQAGHIGNRCVMKLEALLSPLPPAG